MKKHISFILLCVFVLVLSAGVYAADDVNNYDAYLLEVGFPKRKLKDLTDSDKEFMVEYLKERGGDYKFAGVDKKVKIMGSNPQARYISPDRLELWAYHYETEGYNNFPKRSIVFPKFEWKDTWGGLKPHIIRNDSFSYSIDPNCMQILPESSKLQVTYTIPDCNGKTYRKTLERPTGVTWAGDTYRIPREHPLYGNKGIASFEYKRLKDGPNNNVILLHYVYDTNMLNDTTYSVQISDILQISVSSNEDTFEETSERLLMK